MVLVRAILEHTLLLAATLSGADAAGHEDPFASKRVALPSGSMSLDVAVAIMCEQTGVPVSYECVVDRPTDGDAPMPRGLERSFTCTADSLEKTLDRVTAVFGTHVWTRQPGNTGANVIPRGKCRSTDWILNRKYPGFSVTNATPVETMRTLLEVLDIDATGEPTITLFAAGSITSAGHGGDPNDPMIRLYNGRARITATIEAGIVRDALNQITHALGDVWWYFTEMATPTGGVHRYIHLLPVTPRVIGGVRSSSARI